MFLCHKSWHNAQKERVTGGYLGIGRAHHECQSQTPCSSWCTCSSQFLYNVQFCKGLETLVCSSSSRMISSPSSNWPLFPSWWKQRQSVNILPFAKYYMSSRWIFGYITFSIFWLYNHIVHKLPWLLIVVLFSQLTSDHDWYYYYQYHRYQCYKVLCHLKNMYKKREISL